MNYSNPLEDFFYNKSKKDIHKWNHYFDIYHRYFNFYRGKPLTFLEIGIYRGGSLSMWRDYFGPKARIIGVDCDSSCTIHQGNGTEVFIGDQSNPEFLKYVHNTVGNFDIVLDDGGHTMKQQIVSFENLYQHTKSMYMVEDTHTSYWDEYGGGYKNKNSFMEYAKNKCDELNAWHCPELEVNDFVKTTNSIHFYDSIVMFEKRGVEKTKSHVICSEDLDRNKQS